jgi:hypothetical protein
MIAKRDQAKSRFWRGVEWRRQSTALRLTRADERALRERDGVGCSLREMLA